MRGVCLRRGQSVEAALRDRATGSVVDTAPQSERNAARDCPTDRGKSPGAQAVREKDHQRTDVKKVGRIPDEGGSHIDGCDSDHAQGAGRAKSAGARRAYTYLHSAIDSLVGIPTALTISTASSPTTCLLSFGSLAT
jgi:hypothetical protein